MTNTHTRDDRYDEIINGVTIMNPPPAAGHQQIIMMIHDWLVGTSDFPHLHESGLDLGDGDYVVPDMIVFRPGHTPRWDTVLHDPQNVRFVIEVLSPNRGRDLTGKPELYKAAGVGYWLVDGSEKSITVANCPDDPSHEDLASYLWGGWS